MKTGRRTNAVVYCGGYKITMHIQALTSPDQNNRKLCATFGTSPSGPRILEIDVVTMKKEEEKEKPVEEENSNIKKPKVELKKPKVEQQEE